MASRIVLSLVIALLVSACSATTKTELTGTDDLTATTSTEALTTHIEELSGSTGNPKHYAQLANSPDYEFHSHTGRDVARRVGYDEAIIEDISDDVIAS